MAKADAVGVELTRDLKAFYTANDEQAATELDAFAERWESRYPAIVRLWRARWAEFTPPARGVSGDLHDESD